MLFFVEHVTVSIEIRSTPLIFLHFGLIFSHFPSLLGSFSFMFFRVPSFGLISFHFPSVLGSFGGVEMGAQSWKLTTLT